MQRRGLATMLALAATIAAGGPSLKGRKDEVEKAYREAWQKPGDAATLERLAASLPRFLGYAVVEGDILLTERELERYAIEKSGAGQLAAPQGGELIVNTDSGVPTYWSRGSRLLTYAVDRASFSTETRYAIVVANMAKAGDDWLKACPLCEVAFTHVREHDGAPSHERVTFIVRGVDAAGAFVAAAFFPNYAPSRRFLEVDSSYFSTTLDRVGVLRHELGHALGYRHEHIRGISGCYSEASNWFPLTPYDSRSVMHYFCGGAGSMDLKLTRTDKRGHRALYGAP